MKTKIYLTAFIATLGVLYADHYHDEQFKMQNVGHYWVCFVELTRDGTESLYCANDSVNLDDAIQTLKEKYRTKEYVWSVK